MKIAYKDIYDGTARISLRQPRGSQIRNFHVWATLDGNKKQNIRKAIGQLYKKHDEYLSKLAIASDILETEE